MSIDKNFCTFGELLNKFHQNKGNKISTEILNLNLIDGICVHRATVEGEKGIFQGTGDASKASLKPFMQPHFIRMSETRAIARALRWYCNEAKTAKEELIDGQTKTKTPITKPKYNDYGNDYGY